MIGISKKKIHGILNLVGKKRYKKTTEANYGKQLDILMVIIVLEKSSWSQVKKQTN